MPEYPYGKVQRNEQGLEGRFKGGYVGKGEEGARISAEIE